MSFLDSSAQWDDDEVSLAQVVWKDGDKEDDWQHAAAVRVFDTSPVEKLEKLPESVCLQYLRIGGVRNNFLYLCKDVLPRMQNLTVLMCFWYKFELSRDDNKALCAALMQLPHLEQLYLEPSLKNDDQCAQLLHVLHVAPMQLKALSLHFANPLPKSCEHHLCEMLKSRLIANVKCLQIGTQERLPDELCDILREHGQSLQLLHVQSIGDDDFLQKFCVMLSSLRALRDLAIDITHCELLPPFTRFLATRSLLTSSIRKVQLQTVIRSTLEQLDAFYQSLPLTLITDLSIRYGADYSAHSRNFSPSSLVDDGWLYNLAINHKKSVCMTSKRNLSRHRQCAATCRALIAIRKSKKAMTFVPIDIVMMIAMQLMMTRNQSVWVDVDH